MNLIENELQVQLEPAKPAEFCVIWLHGLGADGYDFVPVLEHLQLPEAWPVRFIFPHATIQPVTINNGWSMRSWYDILSAGDSRTINEGEFKVSVERIQSIMSDQIAQGVSPENMLLIGFSQGGAVAYHSALTFSEQVAGVAALSTYLAVEPEVSESINTKLPIWIGHGEQDSVVPISMGQSALSELQRKDFTPEWHSYFMAHEICPQQINDLGLWINKCFLHEAD